ncbi:glutamine--scyllo-inositol transaminase [Anopheles sinensis]|uniref:Glutamine--scyllo-inositol transaminase n=1 Tax=Anopheles sinensis TaxID=74873 RepID=A0A084VKM7_ANOSI|nr:glutamine--scyllo-inositol transaminase [Anopheles sinensis]
MSRDHVNLPSTTAGTNPDNKPPAATPQQTCPFRARYRRYQRAVGSSAARVRHHHTTPERRAIGAGQHGKPSAGLSAGCF